MITIKKYPNRRLYDTSTSQYVNLDTVRDLVRSKREFEIIESKTSVDITKLVLLQIISEQESNDQQSLLTQTVLKQLICNYGTGAEPVVRNCVEKSLSVVLARQGSFPEAANGAVSAVLAKEYS